MNTEEKMKLVRMSVQAVLSANEALKKAKLMASSLSVDTQNLEHIYWIDGRGRAKTVFVNGEFK